VESTALIAPRLGIVGLDLTFGASSALVDDSIVRMAPAIETTATGAGTGTIRGKDN
jgi:hypothetical protein